MLARRHESAAAAPALPSRKLVLQVLCSEIDLSQLLLLNLLGYFDIVQEVLLKRVNHPPITYISADLHVVALLADHHVLGVDARLLPPRVEVGVLHQRVVVMD